MVQKSLTGWATSGTDKKELMDILDGLSSTRRAFLAANLKPPTVLLLESHDEGMRFLSAFRQEAVWSVRIGDAALGKPIEMADGSIWMEIEVMGFKIRWPANRIAMPDGSWAYA